MSLEMRFPMGVLESSNIVADSPSFGTTGQFGDIQIILKAIVLQEDTWTLCMGLEISVPTAPGVHVGLADGTPLVKIANSSTHLLPFFGLLVTPNDNWFIQTYLQVNIPASGDPVSANVSGNGLASTGEIYDQTQLFADAVVGRWLYRNAARRFSGLAAVVESALYGRAERPFGHSGRELHDRQQLGGVQCPGSYGRGPRGLRQHDLDPRLRHARDRGSRVPGRASLFREPDVLARTIRWNLSARIGIIPISEILAHPVLGAGPA